MLLAQLLTCRPRHRAEEDAQCAEPIIVPDGGPTRTVVPFRLERFWNPFSLTYQTEDELWASLGNWDL
jgi:hypothetical protein